MIRHFDHVTKPAPPPDARVAYRKIYFPAQEIHLAREPRAAASAILVNDPRLVG